MLKRFFNIYFAVADADFVVEQSIVGVHILSFEIAFKRIAAGSNALSEIIVALFNIA
ncbi:hypothetical protein SDC9_77224 [bioreactor metagenome]|uniref:Uncharacterized protein n=1 Tax=bioreactor metagenome TaxID=1076179 RepID=A0A644YXF6_9ZZZZ